MNAQHIATGTVVSYEDMRNPLRTGLVVEIKTSEWGTQYGVRWEDGTFDYSDLRQNGWKIG